MKIKTILIIALLCISMTFALDISNYERTPNDNIVYYNDILPAMSYSYQVSDDVIGCRQIYGKNGESILCLESANCNTKKGVFVAQAEAGDNYIIIDCWDKDNIHFKVNDTFITKQGVPPVKSQGLPAWFGNIGYVLLIIFTLFICSKLLKFYESYFLYSVMLGLIIIILEFLSRVVFSFNAPIMGIISILLIKYGYDEEWSKSILTGLIIGLIIFFF